jgi:hypothetical protein
MINEIIFPSTTDAPKEKVQDKTHDCQFIALSFITFILIFLTISPVIAASNQTDISSNQSIMIKDNHLSFVPATIPKVIHDTIAENIAAKNSINEAIADHERKLSEHFLKIDDINSTQIQTNKFFIGSENINLSSNGNKLTSVIYVGKEIPEEGYIQHGSDGKTRIFAADGTQVFYSIDSVSEKIPTTLR